jgi:hypothetical protein
MLQHQKPSSQRRYQQLGQQLETLQEEGTNKQGQPRGNAPTGRDSKEKSNKQGGGANKDGTLNTVAATEPSQHTTTAHSSPKRRGRDTYNSPQLLQPVKKQFAGV